MKKLLIGILFGMFAMVGASTAQAAVLDLSLVTSNPVYVSILDKPDAIFSRLAQAGQGSGSFDPFVRLQGKDKTGVEQGYNTDGTLEFDEKGGPFTHSVQLSQIPLVDIDGINYREFKLDAGNKNFLMLDAMELYLLDGGSESPYPFTPEIALFTLGGDQIKLNNMSGNGIADMYAYIPDIVFSVDSDTYLYLYSRFSNVDPGTFEEWGYDPNKINPTATPEPATMLLFGMGLAGLGVLRRKQA
jgi:hypothetical protein